MSAITIKNIGPISNLSMPVPTKGGVVVLRGRNGSGKSTALDAIESAVSGKGKPPLKDLADRGEVIAGGVNLTVGRAVRRSGELEVSRLEGRLSIADLVDPGIDDPIRADATRIKALVGLSGATLSSDDLHGFPVELHGDIDLSDPVAAMSELKKRLDIGAREYEKLAKAEGDRAAAMLEQAGDIEPSGSVEDAMTELSDAQRRLDRLVHEKHSSLEAKRKVEAARARIAELPQVDVLEAERASAEAEMRVTEARDAALELKAAYNAAVERHRSALAQQEATKSHLDAARKAYAMRAEMERQMAESIPREPPEDEIGAANLDLQSKREALAKSERARQSAELRRQGEDKAIEAERLAAEAVSLRRKSKQTDEVLSEIVGEIKGCPLRVSDGKLIIDTKRGPTMFGELSHGERWRVALDIAIGSIGECGLIVIPQEAWEGLDTDNRMAIAQQAKDGCIVIITAECGDGEIDSEVLP